MNTKAPVFVVTQSLPPDSNGVTATTASAVTLAVQGTKPSSTPSGSPRKAVKHAIIVTPTNIPCIKREASSVEAVVCSPMPACLREVVTQSTCSSYSTSLKSPLGFRTSPSEEEVNKRVLAILKRMTNLKADPKASKSSVSAAERSHVNENQNQKLATESSPSSTVHPSRSLCSTKSTAPKPLTTLASVDVDPKSLPGLPPQSATGRRRCTCSRSCCLKLYCECFAAGMLCSDCTCVSCLNNTEHAELREQAIQQIVQRKPDAFSSKIEYSRENASIHTRGCNCKRSGCLKNYCECFEARIRCTSRCRCQFCYNTAERLLPLPPPPLRSRGSTPTGTHSKKGSNSALPTTVSVVDCSSPATSDSIPTVSNIATAQSLQCTVARATAPVRLDHLIEESVESRDPSSVPPTDPASPISSKDSRDLNRDSPETSDSTSSAPSNSNEMNSYRTEATAESDTTKLVQNPPSELKLPSAILPPAAVPIIQTAGLNVPLSTLPGLTVLPVVPTPSQSSPSIINLPAVSPNVLATWLALMSGAAPAAILPSFQTLPVSVGEPNPQAPVPHPLVRSETNVTTIKPMLIDGPVAQTQPIIATVMTSDSENSQMVVDNQCLANSYDPPSSTGDEFYTEEELETFKRLREQRNQLLNRLPEPEEASPSPHPDTHDPHPTSAVVVKAAFPQRSEDNCLSLSLPSAPSETVEPERANVLSAAARLSASAKSVSLRAGSRTRSRLKPNSLEFARLNARINRISQTVYRQNKIICKLRRLLRRCRPNVACPASAAATVTSKITSHQIRAS
ncbi:unnamed protein product [Calicophoron daubneyi]|uniref:CRC domain-containing protein n=1 Tax=Calicophoron daubneyi TaxID=300641 RepID=A0AAV2T7A6_CALDB